MIIVVDLMRHGQPTGDCVKRNFIRGGGTPRGDLSLAIGDAVLDAIELSDKVYAVAAYRVRFLDAVEVGND